MRVWSTLALPGCASPGATFAHVLETFQRSFSTTTPPGDTILPTTVSETRMEAIRWASLPKNLRLAFVAFALHALFLLLDLIFFEAAYAGGRSDSLFWPALRIVAFCLFAWALLQRVTRPWLIGAIAFAAFLIRDLVRMSEIFAGPALGTAQRQLTCALLISLVVGIGASLWRSTSTPVRTR